MHSRAGGAGRVWSSNGWGLQSGSRAARTGRFVAGTCKFFQGYLFGSLFLQPFRGKLPLTCDADKDGDTTAVYRLAKALAKLQAIYGEATRVMGKGVHAKVIGVSEP